MTIKEQRTDTDLLTSLQNGLINRPELAERFYSILKIADEPNCEGKIRSADEVESLLIEELRKLGNESLVNWAEGVDHCVGKELKQREPKVQMREKKL